MTHPLQSIKPERRPRLFFKLLIATVILMAAIRSNSLTTDAAPFGIISLQFAGTKSEVDRIFDSWGKDGKDRAELSIWLDFPFLALYSTTIGLACVWIGERAAKFSPGTAQVGVALAWAQWLAAAFDIGENIALLTMLLLGTDGASPGVAFWSALFKFLLVGFGLAYCLAGFITSWLWGLRRQSE